MKSTTAYFVLNDDTLTVYADKIFLNINGKEYKLKVDKFLEDYCEEVNKDGDQKNN